MNKNEDITLLRAKRSAPLNGGSGHSFRELDSKLTANRQPAEACVYSYFRTIFRTAAGRVTSVESDCQLPIGHALTEIRATVTPAVEAARTVLEKVREIGPGEVEPAFLIKVSGGADWLIANPAGEARFEVKLTWPAQRRPGTSQADKPNPAEPEAEAAAGDEPAREPVPE